MSQLSTKLLERFSNDFAQLLETEYDYNVVVKVGNQTFKLHSLVLYQRSSFFRKELSTAIKKNNIIEITLTQTTVESFKILIKYIYTGTIPLEEVEPSTIFDLLVSSNKLGFEGLVEYIQSYLIDNKASWLRLKFTQVYSTSFQENNFKPLQAFCTDILVKHPSLIFNSDDFTSIQENALLTLLNRDDLQMEESEIWDKVIQWGKAKTPDLPFDLKQWTEKNFLDLKTKLDKCIHLIRFFQMSGEDILVKVEPYQQILESNLWNDIVTKNIAPNRSISSIILPARKKIPAQLPARKKIPDQLPVCNVHFINPSSIINNEHFAEISSWIDRHSSIYDVTKIPYKFNLLIRGSRDGFTSEIFHRLCDYMPGTVVIIKVNGTNEILGGYNPLVWASNYELKWSTTTDSFIFSLKTQNSTQFLPNSILSRVINANRAIGCCSYYGPVFGDNFGMLADIKQWYYVHKKAYFEKRLRSDDQNLVIDEIEVFQVLKN
ncbi:hypothetical protein C2G38_2047062 [Gigaspora rosea]|uniref:Kelch-like protein 17 n=1 Tax=Gigaspora rosea TaxID=44941 RepID=A0A397U753_9GLOM|nr:hypothetical protein C2G38_2047062 [Gigaspora rosea]